MKATLPTNYQDDILNVSTEGKRKYRMNYNDDGTVSFVDVTPYDQEGSDFGAGDINATNQAVNESFDKNKLIRDMDAINALTEEGYAPDALALKDVSDSLSSLIKTQVFDIPSTTISGKSLAQIVITPNIPDGYSIVGGIGYTSDAGVHSYLRYYSNNAVIVLRNWADGSNTVTGKFVVFFSK